MLFLLNTRHLTFLLCTLYTLRIIPLGLLLALPPLFYTCAQAKDLRNEVNKIKEQQRAMRLKLKGMYRFWFLNVPRSYTDKHSRRERERHTHTHTQDTHKRHIHTHAPCR